MLASIFIIYIYIYFITACLVMISKALERDEEYLKGNIIFKHIDVAIITEGWCNPIFLLKTE